MRLIIIASLLAFAATAYAADDKVDKSAKKTGDGFGNLLKGMGQETKKATGGKDDKKASKSASSKEDKK
ncbi:MAG TPA: hypothetical protein VMS53_01635 [Burkholderiales bacterium]|jgi:hypothetical protein|nr:hypothetical protein [Burkholderiales bacterium]